MQFTKTFVTSNNTATITCPGCNRSRNVQTEKYRHRRHTLKVRCSCRHRFTVLLDYRRHYRKQTNLEGTYVMMPPAFGKGTLTVANLSKNGIGFSVVEAIGNNHPFSKGSKAKITFQLDNKKRTVIEKAVIVRFVSNSYVGAEFLDLQAFEKDLGFYLRF